MSKFIDGIQNAEKEERRRLTFELIEQSANNPGEVIDLLPALVDVCLSSNEAGHFAAASTIGNIAERNPWAVAPHVDQLIIALDNESENVREAISSALTHVASVEEIPTSQLLSYLEHGNKGAGEAIDILATIATNNPSTLPINQIEKNITAGNEAVNTGAEYLLTLLASIGQCEPPYHPTYEGYQELSQQLYQDLPSSKSKQFLINLLQRRTIDAFFLEKLESSEYHSMELTKTPMGTQVLVKVKHSNGIISENNDKIMNISGELEETFDLDNLELDVTEIEDTSDPLGHTDAIDRTVEAQHRLNKIHCQFDEVNDFLTDKQYDEADKIFINASEALDDTSDEIYDNLLNNKILNEDDLRNHSIKSKIAELRYFQQSLETEIQRRQDAQAILHTNKSTESTEQTESDNVQGSADLLGEIVDKSTQDSQYSRLLSDNISESSPIVTHLSAAEELIEEAATATSSANFDAAIDAYTAALTQYQDALEELDAGDAGKKTKIKEVIELTRKDLRATKTQYKHRKEITEVLQLAERSFQEAIVAFVTQEKTLARIRFRQARDAFREAEKIVENSDSVLLNQPIELNVEPSLELSSRTFSKIPNFSDPVTSILSEAQIDTVGDIEGVDGPPWTPQVIEELSAENKVSDRIAVKLSILSWWHNNNYEFETVKSILRRQQQAGHGFKQSNYL